jgi:hypothetical protein
VLRLPIRIAVSASMPPIMTHLAGRNSGGASRTSGTLCLRCAGDEDVKATGHSGTEETRCLRRQRPQFDEMLEPRCARQTS